MIISYSELGKHGRLGNQMFQYAALYGAAFMRGFQPAIPDDSDLSIKKAFKLPSANNIGDHSPVRRYNEPNFLFMPNLWLVSEGTDICGYFQSSNYWAHCADRIFEEFEFHDHIKTAGNKWLVENNLNNKLVCSMHVRRGDYTNISHYHHNLSLEYYKQAHGIISDNIKEEIQYLIFSDDPVWCKENFGGAKIVEGNSEAVDMYIMSKLPIHIIANSSFSWWAAALSRSQAVIAPKTWFGPKGPKNWESIYMSHWTKI